MMIAGLAIPAATATPATSATIAPASGVDVSPFTTINSWTQVRQAGNSFAGVEATFAKKPASTYAADVEAATAAGLYVMPYAFVFPYDPTHYGTVDQQAQAAVNTVNSVTSPAYGSSSLMLPLVVDIEPDPYYQSEGTTQCYGLTQQAMVNWIQTFINDVSSLGKTPIIYTLTSFWNTCTGNSTAFSRYPLWLASWGVSNPSLPSGWNNYTFWQYTSSGTVSGIQGGTDLDYLGPVQQVSQTGTPIGPVQLRTLTSLNGQSVSYTAPPSGTAGSLPPGLTMSPSGQITGTPSGVGQYTVMVTPSAGTVPSSMTFTWDVHGAITVNSPGNRTTTAGTPVSLRIGTSGPDQNAGFAPALKSAGLPPGLTMSSSGLITGWPYIPGTYTVKITASDGLGGAGSTSFTWKVGAAGNSGTAGTIRQVGGSGKCLNDPGSATANGTKPNMWTCNGKSYQNWTIVQDGTIRMAGKCLDMAGTGSAVDTPVQLWTCNSGNGAQQWQAGSYGELVNPQSGKCLYIPANSAANGTKPTVHACSNDVRHHWLRPAAPVVSGEPGKCLAVSGSAVELVTCANVASQHWVAESNGTVELSGKCLTENGTTAGSQLSLASCSGASSQKWTVVSAGRIATELKSAASGRCVSVPSTSTASGTKLVIESCAANPAGTWHVE
jgi:GH25 family lysozyme M1 (1,4-beta-N-acetylmuramidase)